MHFERFRFFCFAILVAAKAKLFLNTTAFQPQSTRACVNQGAGYALVSGDKVCMLKGDAAQLAKFAGQNVTVKA